MMTDQEYETALSTIHAHSNGENDLLDQEFENLVNACLEYEQEQFPITEELFEGTDLEWLCETDPLS